MNAYTDRYHAGRVLAEAMPSYLCSPDTLVLAIPKGGVPVAYEVALSLSLPLDVLVVQKLAIPGMRDFTIGSIAKDNCITFNEAIIRQLGIRKTAIDHIVYSEYEELMRKESLYHKNKPMMILKDKTVIIIDDGIGSGSTMRTAVQSIKSKDPAKIVIASPIAKKSTYDELKNLVFDVICPEVPVFLESPDLWYQDYSSIAEKDIMRLLQNACLHL